MKKMTVPTYPKALVEAAKAFENNQPGAVDDLIKILKAKRYGRMAEHFKGKVRCEPPHKCLLIQEILSPRAVSSDDSTETWVGKGNKPTIRSIITNEDIDLSDDFRLICCAAERLGIQKIYAVYDGMGDDGSIEELSYHDRFGRRVEVNSATTKEVIAQFKLEQFSQRGQNLDTAVERLIESILPRGWEICEGSEGNVTINCLTRRMFIEHRWRQYQFEEDEISYLL